MQEQLGIAGSEVAYADQTVLHPVGFAALVALGITMLAVPRKHAIV